MSGQARRKNRLAVEPTKSETTVTNWQEDKMQGLRVAAIAGDGSAISLLEGLVHDDAREISVRQLALWSLYQTAVETKCSERQAGIVQIIQRAASLPGLHESVGSYVLNLTIQYMRHVQGPKPERRQGENDDVHARHLAFVAMQKRAVIG